ncbi:MAG: hypothetical protein JKY99_08825 [Rhizobiales bacterium]|nr:hypothetical protein [Hyphomicrobiales bacterium]
MRVIEQPGLVATERHTVCPTDAIPISIELPAGQILLSGVTDALSKLGYLSACLQIKDALISTMHFVMPAPSPDEDHVAWWSETHIIDCSADHPGRIEEAGFIYGWREGGPFIHCHGAWRDRNSTYSAGHMLPDTCVLSSATTLTGWAFPDARFEGAFDAETNFTLFHPAQLTEAQQHKPASAVILRLRPNVEIGDELIAICQDLGWGAADIYGLGSLIGARFRNGRVLESFATEFLVRSGKVWQGSANSGSDIDILVVGINGEIMQGMLQAGENAVLMTCELVLIRSDTD